jgi:hypothetical protein
MSNGDDEGRPVRNSENGSTKITEVKNALKKRAPCDYPIYLSFNRSFNPEALSKETLIGSGQISLKKIHFQPAFLTAAQHWLRCNPAFLAGLQQRPFDEQPLDLT